MNDLKKELEKINELLTAQANLVFFFGVLYCAQFIICIALLIKGLVN